jgi:hypothetical protein
MVQSFRKRALFIGLAVFLVFAAVFAEAYVVTHLDHDCAGLDCRICLQIETAGNLLKSLALVGFAAFSSCLGACAKALNESSYSCPWPPNQVSLKVRFNA